MRFKILLIVFFISFRNLSAQTPILSDTAFNAFHNGNFAQAIKLYKQLIKSEEGLRYYSQYSNLMLSMCYTRLDSIEQAKGILIGIVYPKISIPLSYDMSIQEDARQKLADLYFKEKNYKKALECYSIHDAKWASAHFSDINQFDYNYHRAISMSKCYEGMALIDSAVAALSPYLFSSYRDLGYLFKFFREPNNLKDSLKHDSVCMRYLSLLKQRHSIRSIKAELKKAEKNFSYSQTMEPAANDTSFLWLKVVCYFYFYGTKIPYIEYCAGDNRKKLIALSKQPVFTREYQLAYFLSLPLCRMIRELH